MSGDAEALLAAFGVSSGWAWAAFLVFVRTGAAIALLPAFGELSVPVRVRLGLALAFTAIVAPAVAGHAWPPPGVLPVLGEAAAGLLLGFGLRLMIHALQIAGTIAAQSITLTQLFGGTAGEPQPAVANLFMLAGLALAVAGGLHVAAAQLLVLSYDVLPAGAPPVPGDAAALGVAQVARAFGLAFSLAAPFVAAALLYNVALGIINRAMPMLMVTFVGAPALTLGALALLAVVTPVLMTVWTGALRAQLGTPFGLP
jgi:flagellar biosynthetic protein FliR